jgi:2-methylisocitrate lyase-like PEP mutase family enzyme
MGQLTLFSRARLADHRSKPRSNSLSIRCCSASGAQRTAALRKVLAKPGLLLGPAAYDGISARLTEEAGFDFAFMSGFSVAGGRLAKPDTGLLSFAEMLDQGRCMHEATKSIPIIGDGDTGYGNALNVKRTVSQYSAAGFAGILIEDQQWPKSCGHVRGKRVVSREEAISRIRAACDARDALDTPDKIVIVARTDARQAVSFQEAMARAAAFAEVGADVVFVDALESAAEMRTLCAEVPNAYKMANMLEGGGKTPILTPEELEVMGFKLCAYPLSLLGVSINAMR